MTATSGGRGRIAIDGTTAAADSIMKYGCFHLSTMFGVWLIDYCLLSGKKEEVRTMILVTQL